MASRFSTISLRYLFKLLISPCNVEDDNLESSLFSSFFLLSVLKLLFSLGKGYWCKNEAAGIRYYLPHCKTRVWVSIGSKQCCLSWGLVPFKRLDQFRSWSLQDGLWWENTAGIIFSVAFVILHFHCWRFLTNLWKLIWNKKKFMAWSSF